MRRWRIGVALIVLLGVVSAACGDDGGGNTQGSPQSESTAAPADDEPVAGGIVTIGQFSASPGFDPAKLTGGGPVGGMELAAIYDTIMRWDPDAGRYEPVTAESLTPNADHSVWTLKLKDGIRFTDGTAYDAEAVRFSLTRLSTEGTAGPRGQLNQFLAGITVTDPLTLEITLKQGWQGFPYLLSGVAGLVYSPTAFAAAGDGFNASPGDAGAGPFKLKSFKPGEVIELERNPDYHGGDVYLDGLRFILLDGGAGALEALKAASVDAAFIRDPASITDAKKSLSTIDIPAVAGTELLMNAGIRRTCTGGQPASLCDGKPDGTAVQTVTATSNVLVRRAVAAAVDPRVINERVYDGHAVASSALFANTPWDPGMDGPRYDLDEAKRLVQQAKAEGWDGRIRLLGDSTPASAAIVQAVTPMLQLAGMEVESDTSKDVAGRVAQVTVQADFDLAVWGAGLLVDPDVNYPVLAGAYGSASPRYGYSSADFDAALDQLRDADTDEKRKKAFGAITEVWNRDVPAFVLAQLPQAIVLDPAIRGVKATALSNALWSDAWIAQ